MGVLFFHVKYFDRETIRILLLNLLFCEMGTATSFALISISSLRCESDRASFAASVMFQKYSEQMDEACSSLSGLRFRKNPKGTRNHQLHVFEIVVVSPPPIPPRTPSSICGTDEEYKCSGFCFQQQALSVGSPRSLCGFSTCGSPATRRKSGV